MFSRHKSFISTHNLYLLYYLIRQKNLLKIIRIFLSHRQNRTTRLEDCLSKFTKNPPQFNLPQNQRIDIILPVYNGFEYLEKLFASIFGSTNVLFRIIIIDDCSSDERVLPFLRKINSENPERTLLLRNEENIGFVKSVNRGFTYSDNHFVIMNTDIEVPPKWLERLMTPIFDNPDIASTTPFSNAADIFSFPGLSESSEIFEGHDVTSLDSYFQHIDTDNKYIEIPSGVGFCMGMNRNAVEKIGMFDSETFHQGYCEENDWCMQAKKNGFINILVPNLFVYHKQSGSFLDKGKKRLMKKNYWLLINRHKNYLPAIYEFTLKDPLRPFRELLILMITAKTEKNRPVAVIGYSPKDQGKKYAPRAPERLYREKKILRLFHDKKRKSIFLQYRYGSYNIEMSIADLKEFETLIEWLDIKTIVLESMNDFPNTNEAEAFFHRLNKKLAFSP